MVEQRTNAAGQVVEYNDESGRWEPVKDDGAEHVAPEYPDEPVRNEEEKNEKDVY